LPRGALQAAPRRSARRDHQVGGDAASLPGDAVGAVRRRAPGRAEAEMSTGHTAFTVGIPVLNEEAILVPNTERLLHYLDGLGREYEILSGSHGLTRHTHAL